MKSVESGKKREITIEMKSDDKDGKRLHQLFLGRSSNEAIFLLDLPISSHFMLVILMELEMTHAPAIY